MSLLNKYNNYYQTIVKNQNCKEFYTIYFSRFISRFLTPILAILNMSPNFITLTMIPIGLLSFIFLTLSDNYNFFIIGCFLLIFTNIIDTIDGELARVLNKTSITGDYLDKVSHYCVNFLGIFAIGIFIFNVTLNNSYLYLAFISTFLFTIDNILRDLLITCGIHELKDNSRKKISEKSSFRKGAQLLIKKLLLPLFSNNGLFHISFLLGIFYKFSTISFIEIYYLFFTFVTLIKLFCRSLIIKKILK